MKKKNNMKNLTPYITLFLFIMVCLILVNFKGTKINEISYDEFMSFMNNDKIEKLTKDLEQYKNLEKTLQNTLVMAQTTAEEVKIAAKQQADQLIAEARNKASEIQQEENEASLKKLDEIEKQIAIKERRFEDVKKQFDVYKAKMESLLISQEELIKEINQDEEE